eukprot:CAMPEP_0201496814 /NCGR_PEP_ID=MMETSP0151_2-20130828/61902_1 /ASSEMBLY_ACC=CAM_ASM_000257 /TAXON_ID=200890 /ORGANISM="Paramoeba atlantica, Strain 621/1 / CCAP 1560/9" /LENGTH=135 /DNA_ID=CAMNT_0047886927 /DNA_START=56 /DNA_END=459 /DNA_ORIENTATION=+
MSSKGGKGKGGKGGNQKGGKGGKGGGKGDKEDLKTCNHVKGRHILCEKHGKISECYNALKEGWLDDGDKVPPAEFGKLAMKYSECSSGRRGGDLGWFPRGKMVGTFQDVAFKTAVGGCSGIFKTSNGYHIFLCEG